MIYITRILQLFLLATVAGSTPIAILAQDEPRVSTPVDEEFIAASGLIASWMGCLRMPDNRPEHGCDKIEYSAESMSSHNFSLYEGDGSLWWRASRIQQDKYRDPELPWFFADKKKGFSPLFYADGRNIILRLVAESENWYEVEINEQTRETKFVSNVDPAWYRTDWDFWLEFSVWIMAPKDQRLYDTPAGTPQESLAGGELGCVKYVRRSGDWAYVRQSSSSAPQLSGWIPWRSGRDVLSRCIP